MRTDSNDPIGVIIGRFQVPDLHEGHKALIQSVQALHQNVLVVIGVSPTRGTDTDPLDYETRRLMLKGILRESDGTLNVLDTSSDALWSAQIDSRLSNAIGDRPCLLYGSRDSFIPHYTGQYPTQELEASAAPSGTEVRTQVGKAPLQSADFRAGVIYASQQKYPISYQTVDVAIFDRRWPNLGGEGYRILLGRKPSETAFRFPGGFVDATDQSLEDAAFREAREETNLALANVHYLSSYRVDDFRYRKASDKIMTALFTAYAPHPHFAQAGDDLAEVRWFDAIPAPDMIVPAHHGLMFRVLSYLRDMESYTGGRLPFQS